jgi:hypothetical protein
MAGIIAMHVLGAAALCRAQDPATTPSETESASPFSVTLSVDFVTIYYFRGIAQENQGFIAQPEVSGSVAIYRSDDGWLNELSLFATSWNSIQTGPTGEGSPEYWYETDAAGGLSAVLFDDWTLTLTYVAYLSPNGAFNTSQEMSLGIEYDDSNWLGKWALHPRMLLAVELDGQSDVGNSNFPGTSEGVYLELGVRPQLELTQRAADNIAVAFPLTLGLGLHDYYETADGDDQVFGFFDAGAELIVPLDLPGPGAWTVNTGPHVIWLGDNAAELSSGITGDKHFNVWFILGVSVSF